MNAKEMRMKIDAEYKARSLYIELYEAAGDDKSLLINGLSVAMNVIKNDLLALLPPPPPPSEEKTVSTETSPHLSLAEESLAVPAVVEKESAVGVDLPGKDT